MSLRDEMISKDIERFQVVLGLKPGADLELVLLKGHLLIEELLNDLIEFHMTCPNELSDARLEFYQKLCLAKALHDPTIEPDLQWVWDGVKKVNTLRNQIAHNLSPVGFEDRLADFAQFIGKQLPGPIVPGSGPEYRVALFGMTMSFLSAYFSKVVRSDTHGTADAL